MGPDIGPNGLTTHPACHKLTVINAAARMPGSELIDLFRVRVSYIWLANRKKAKENKSADEVKARSLTSLCSPGDHPCVPCLVIRTPNTVGGLVAKKCAYLLDVQDWRLLQSRFFYRF